MFVSMLLADPRGRSGCYASPMSSPPLRLRDLPGLGPKSEAALARVGVCSVAQLMDEDPYAIYARLRTSVPNVSMNWMYALIGAQEGLSWQEVARTRRTGILLRLDELGLLPRKS